MDGEQGVVLLQHLGQLHQLLPLAEGAGGIDQPQGHTEGARLQLPLQQVLQLLHLLRFRVPVHKAHHRPPQGAVAHQLAVVGGAAVVRHHPGVLLQAGHSQLGQAPGGQLQLAEEVAADLVPALRRAGQDGDAAVAGDLGGDALVQLALRLIVHQGAGVRVSVDVDEAGGHRQSGHVHHLPGLLAALRGDAGDAPLPDADVSGIGLGTLPVHHRAAPQDQIIHRDTSILSAVSLVCWDAKGRTCPAGRSVPLRFSASCYWMAERTSPLPAA